MKQNKKGVSNQSTAKKQKKTKEDEELRFLPEWARKGPEKNPFGEPLEEPFEG